LCVSSKIDFCARTQLLLSSSVCGICLTSFSSKLPRKYRENLAAAARSSNNINVTTENLVNAFNEWGENMAFEPCNKYEYYNLNLLNECLMYEQHDE
jgi:hypothetical protein